MLLQLGKVLAGHFRLADGELGAVPPGFAADYHNRVGQLKYATAVQQQLAADTSRQDEGVGSAFSTDLRNLRADPGLAQDPRLKDAELLIGKGDKDSLGKAAKLLTTVAEDRVAALQKKLGDLRREAVRASSFEVQAEVAVDPFTPADELRRLAHDQKKLTSDPPMKSRDLHMFLREAIAGNPGAPADLLQELAGDPDPVARTAVAKNTSAPEKALKLVHQLSDPKVKGHHTYFVDDVVQEQKLAARVALANNKGTPADVMNKLLADPDRHVRLAMAQVQGASPDRLRALAKDPDYEVRAAVAANEATPTDVLDQLHKDSYANDWQRQQVAQGLASNPKASATMLGDLAGDQYNEFVRAAVAKHKSTPETALVKLAGDQSRDIAMAVVSRSPLPVSVLRALSGSRIWDVREAVARRPDVPEDVLRALAKDPEPSMRAAVAANPATPVDVLLAFAKDRSPGMRDARIAMLEHPKLTQSPVLRQKAMLLMIQDPDREVRLGVARAPRPDRYVMDQLSGDSDPLVRSIASDYAGKRR